MRLFIYTLIITLLVAGSAYSAPSFRGYTGLVVVPTADVLEEGDWDAGVMTEDIDELDANDIFLNYGAAQSLEVGINSALPVDFDERETLVNGKYQLMPETESRAAVAFGLIDFTDEVEATAYMVVSKSLVRGIRAFDSDITNLRGHIGFGGGRLDGMFVGLSAFIGNRAMFSVEYDSSDVNLGFKFTPVRGIRLHAAWFDLGGADDLGIGASFSRLY